MPQIDLTQAWAQWKPTAADPWSRKWAGHLYRRAGFGASREELLTAEQLGHEATIELLLRGNPKADDLLPTLNDVGAVAARGDVEKLRDWWLYCMLHGKHPLREKLTLFWHNHFATSIAKVRLVNLMFVQNRTLREHALGKFGPFLQAVSRDPAMLLWLDSNSNVKGKPNENYAREVMELFSLGVGNYTEKDIREAARAFTGWHTDHKTFRFKPELHDADPKTFFGKTGNWDGGDIVRIILEQPAAAKFLVGKLYAYFVSEAPPPAGLLEPLADSFRTSDYDIAALMKTILSSKWFFSEHAFRKRIKSPVEFVLGAAKSVYREHEEAHADYRPLPHTLLTPRVSAMAQMLFAPPNVKGWPGGKAWLSTATMLERNNFASALAFGSVWNPPDLAFAVAEGVPPPQAFDPARVVAEEKAETPAAIVQLLLDVYLPGGTRPEVVSRLAASVAEGKPGPQRIRETVQAILTLPEYQLC